MTPETKYAVKKPQQGQHLRMRLSLPSQSHLVKFAAERMIRAATNAAAATHNASTLQEDRSACPSMRANVACAPTESHRDPWKQASVRYGPLPKQDINTIEQRSALANVIIMTESMERFEGK